MNRILKYIVTLNLPVQVLELIAFGRAMVQAMGSPNNLWFANLNPSIATQLAAVIAHLNDLEAAEALARTKAPGAAAARDEKRAVVEKDLNHLRGGVIQVVVDQNAGHEQEIAESAGAGIKKRSVRQKRVFKAAQGPLSGLVELEAAFAGRFATHYWQMSTDQKVWSSLPDTHKGSTSVANLTPGTIYFFRHRALTANGLSDWDQIVSILVR